MTVKEIFVEIIKIRMKKSGIHDELSRCYLAINSRHENRRHEYYKKAEDMKIRALERFYQHHSHSGDNIYIKQMDVEDIFTAKNLGMSDKFNRFEVTSETIKTKTKQYFYLWEEFLEKALMSMEEHYISMLIGLKKPFYSHRIMEEIEDLAEELKRVRVCIVEYEAVDFNPAVINAPKYVEHVHDEYQQKAKDLKIEDYI